MNVMVQQITSIQIIYIKAKKKNTFRLRFHSLCLRLGLIFSQTLKSLLGTIIFTLAQHLQTKLERKERNVALKREKIKDVMGIVYRF